MIIEKIDSVERFAQLRSEWNSVLQASSSNCVFLTHEWLFTWWKHLAEGRGLAILTARIDGRLVGILPLAVRDPQYVRMVPRVFEFLGSGVIGSDYLDAIVSPEVEDQVMRAFADYLHKRGLLLQLNHLKRGGSLALRVSERLEHARWTVGDTKINVCPFINLSGHSWDSYLGTLSSSQRYNFNRRLRNLVKTSEMHLERVDSASDAQRALDFVMELHHKRWGARGTSEAFQTDETVAFHREFVQLAAERGWLRLFILWTNKVPAAALYGLRYGPTFSFYQSGFDPAHGKQSVGLVIMGLAIKSALEEGASEYDFLHGSEEYKFHWTTEVKQLGRLELYPPHARGHIYKRAIEFNRVARSVARRMLK